MIESVYIHIPFCKSKCKYCSFVSFNKPELITGYMYSLMKEISESYRGEALKTIYFGGGTPSLIPADLIKKVLKKFKTSEDAEITLEINPDDSSYEYLTSLKAVGINRISIGAQTFNNDILRLIGRRHSAEQILSAVADTKRAGFKNISIDLIYGLPYQTMEGLTNDLEKILSLGINHISTYGLKIEEESIWGKNPPKVIPDDDMQADMYELINKILENSGFERYEISNFSLRGFESRHNLNYWNNNEYYGFGVSAHGYVDGIRYSNKQTIEEYMNNPITHEYGRFLTDKEKLEEEIFLGFRKTEGINTKNINERYNLDFDNKFESVLRKYRDYIEKTESGYRLNLKGVLISNVILAEFL